MTLRLSPAARWVVERYPVDDVVERRGGGVDATFPVASERWLERLLVRLGPEAEVRSPAEWRALGRRRRASGCWPATPRAGTGE